MTIALDFCSDPLIRKASQLFKVDAVATLEIAGTKDERTEGKHDCGDHACFSIVSLKISPPDEPLKEKPKRKREKAIDLTGDLFA